MKTLELEKRGCDFWKDEKLESDCENFRLCTADTIKGKDGRNYFLEFALLRNRGHMRKVSKNGKKILKHPVFEIDIKEGLYFTNQYENNEGCWQDAKINQAIWDLNLSYTKKDILKAVNFISKDKYSSIKFIER